MDFREPQPLCEEKKMTQEPAAEREPWKTARNALQPAYEIYELYERLGKATATSWMTGCKWKRN